MYTKIQPIKYKIVMKHAYKLGEPMEHIYWQRRVLIIIMELYQNQGIDVYYGVCKHTWE